MPELPEIETLKRALLPLVKNKTLIDSRFFREDIRFPIPCRILKRELTRKKITGVTRKGKYLLLHSHNGAMIWHLGMSGRIIQYGSMDPVEKHTHAVFHFEGDTFLHFIDPRRFGCILWAPKDEGHPLLNHLGPDPLEAAATAKVLKTRARNCKAPIKSFLMDARRLAGIGNIYACESLFAAPIHPRRPAGKLTLADWERLISALRRTLNNSIASGGTTLRDFFNTDQSPGYYALQLSVYGRENQPCPQCGAAIVRVTHSGRSTFFCKVCQKK
ncbi:MAG: bifunctional DNA-formamidopyrimidine glycosylase/DNA-(apurinic or apyrimidinic site) lyase [Nitrospinaceae bacterium]